MATKPICRVGDQVTGTCRAISGSGSNHPRTFTGTWQTGSSIVKCDDIGVVRVDDTGITDCGHTFKAIEGSSIATDTTNGKKLHRVGDAVQIIDGGGGEGVSVTGSPSSSTE